MGAAILGRRVPGVPAELSKPELKPTLELPGVKLADLVVGHEGDVKKPYGFAEDLVHLAVKGAIGAEAFGKNHSLSTVLPT